MACDVSPVAMFKKRMSDDLLTMRIGDLDLSYKREFDQ